MYVVHGITVKHHGSNRVRLLSKVSLQAYTPSTAQDTSSTSADTIYNAAPSTGSSVSGTCFYAGPIGAVCTQTDDLGNADPHYYCGPTTPTGSNYNCIETSSTVYGCTPDGQICQLGLSTSADPCNPYSNLC